MKRTYSIPDSEIKKLRTDERNTVTPFKAVAQGVQQPVRFSSKEAALKFFNAFKGRCLLSHNTYEEVTFIAYKFN